MKRIFTLTLFACLFTSSTLFAQIDYIIVAQFPDVPMFICQDAGSGVGVVFNDLGFNALDTYYQFYNNDGFVLNGFVNGLVSDGTGTVLGIAFSTLGIAPGTYNIHFEASHDPTFVVDVISAIWVVNIEPAPVATIATPDGTLLCDGGSATLIGDAGAATSSYSWDPGGETTSTIVVNAADTYEFTATSLFGCGSSTASVDITSGTSPSINSVSCETVSDVGTVVVDANDPDALGLTYQWYENGGAISDGGDFTITDGATMSTLSVANVHDNHQGSAFTCEVTNSCGTVTSAPCVTLPVELTYFSGNVVDEVVQLKWGTATETNSDYFAVERSFNGRDFETIGQVGAAGNSLKDLEYRFDDQTVASIGADENVYYRLRQTDLDGAFSLTHLVNVKLDGSNQLELQSIFAADNMVSLQFHTPNDGPLEASVINLSGQIIHQELILAAEGYNRYEISDLQLPAGFYLMQLSNGARTHVLKFTR